MNEKEINKILEDIKNTKLDLSEEDLERAKNEVVYLFDLKDYKEITEPKIRRLLSDEVRS